MCHSQSYLDVNSVSFNGADFLFIAFPVSWKCVFFVLTCFFLLFAGEQGWLEVVRLQVSHLCDPDSNPGVDAVRGLSLLLVLFFDPGGFSAGTPVFPCPRNQHFQIPIRPGTLCAWVNKLKFL